MSREKNVLFSFAVFCVAGEKLRDRQKIAPTKNRPQMKISGGQTASDFRGKVFSKKDSAAQGLSQLESRPAF